MAEQHSPREGSGEFEHLSDVPSWALMQELKRRGDLRIAPASEAGRTKRESTPDGITVDARGLPLYQVMFEGEDRPECEPTTTTGDNDA